MPVMNSWRSSSSTEEPSNLLASWRQEPSGTQLDSTSWSIKHLVWLSTGSALNRHWRQDSADCCSWVFTGASCFLLLLSSFSCWTKKLLFSKNSEEEIQCCKVKPDPAAVVVRFQLDLVWPSVSHWLLLLCFHWEVVGVSFDVLSCLQKKEAGVNQGALESHFYYIFKVKLGLK